MKLILVADIFGKTDALEALADQLSSSDFISTTIIDPYAGRNIDFANEDQAYAYFNKTAGIQHYSDIILETVENAGRNLHLVGFSVGASAIWARSGDISPEKNIKATCFYGSQIRHYLYIDPNIPMDMYFPSHEPHFDVSDLISQLSLKNRVTCSMVPYLHGFMNRRSRNYNTAGYIHHINILIKGRGNKKIPNVPE